MINKNTYYKFYLGINMKKQNVKNNIVALSLLASMAISMNVNCKAADGFLGGVGSLLGSTTAGIFDVPEGILVNSLYRMPLKTTKALAERFGDEKGFYQNVIGATIGIPTGFVFGIPYGAITGAKHGLTSGWEKPFSTESYLVKDEE